MFESVREKLKSLGISPVFFVGSGLSRRYINSPNWLGLLKESTDGLGISFKKYQQKHTYFNSSTGKNEIRFEELAQDLESVYYEQLPVNKLEDNKSQSYYYKKAIAEIVSQYLESNKERMLNNDEVKELQKTTPAAIITTNYDEMLEVIFGDEYTAHVGQTSLLTSVVDGVGDIYKIHGSVTDCNSIVITKNDYDRFFEKEIYLNSKILTLFLEYPIVFLGYSISDRNVQSILSTIFNTLPYDKLEELKSRMWFITLAEDGIEKELPIRINLNDGEYIDNIQSFELNDFGKFYKAINDISIKRLPIRFLKYLKHNTYQLVASQEYNPKLLNVNVEQLERIKDFNEGNNFVGLSFSVEKRKSIPTKLELWEAFVDDKEADYDEYSILGFKAESRTRIPFYKFIRNLKKDEILIEVEEKFGKDSELYKLIINDTKNYTKPIGVKMDVSDFDGEISISNVEEYADKYMKKDGVLFNQRITVIRNVLLKQMESNVKKIASNKKFCENYWKELSVVITNLLENYINENVDDLKIILRIISKDRLNDNNIKNLICFLDRAIYRNQIEGI